MTRGMGGGTPRTVVRGVMLIIGKRKNKMGVKIKRKPFCRKFRAQVSKSKDLGAIVMQSLDRTTIFRSS